MTITAAWNPTNYTYTLTSALPGDVHWWRSTSWPDGRSHQQSLGAGNPIVDAMVPLSPGASVTWTASAGGSSEVLTVAPPVPAMPVLTVPTRPDLAGVQVVVQRQRASTWSQRSGVYDVLGRTLPWVEPMPPIERTIEQTFRIEHPGGAFPGVSLRRFRALMGTGAPVLLRSTCNERVETLTFLPMPSWVEDPPGNDDRHGPDRVITMTCRVVDPLMADEGIEVTARLWLHVPIEFETWDDVAANVATWDELVHGPAGGP